MIQAFSSTAKTNNVSNYLDIPRLLPAWKRGPKSTRKLRAAVRKPRMDANERESRTAKLSGKHSRYAVENLGQLRVAFFHSRLFAFTRVHSRLKFLIRGSGPLRNAGV